MFPSLVKKQRPKKHNSASQAQFIDGVVSNPIGPLLALTNGGASIYGTGPSRWENDIHHFHEKHSNESNIIRCNNRLKSNFLSPSEDMIVEALSKLGVVSGTTGKDLTEKLMEQNQSEQRSMEVRKAFSINSP